MPVCQVCQHNNPAGAEFCEECGAALNATGTAAGAPGAPASVPGQPLTPAPPPGPQDAAPPASGTGEATPPASEPIDSGGSAVADASVPAGESGPATTEQGAAQPAAGTAQRPRLVPMRFGAPTGEEIPLMGQRVVVGRFDPETGPVDIDLSSTPESVHISRQHAELYQEDGRWMVRDLGSTNGVFVKGSGDASFGPRITAPRPLAGGDEVAFGNSRFVFRMD